MGSQVAQGILLDKFVEYDEETVVLDFLKTDKWSVNSVAKCVLNIRGISKFLSSSVCSFPLFTSSLSASLS